MRLKESKGYILKKVLATLENGAIALSRHSLHGSLGAFRVLRDFEQLQDMSDRQLRSVSRYTLDKKYITISKIDGKIKITLTNAGKTIMQRGALKALRPKKQDVWDHRWRIVIFDIPNYLKSARDAFAATLKRLGFIHFQKSVFLCPYPCEEELEILVDYFGISKHVEIIIAS